MTSQPQGGFALTDPAISQRVEEVRAKYRIPALVVLAMQSARFELIEVQGTRVAGTENAVTLNDFFHIGSCGKSVLAVMAGKLVEQGKLRWKERLFDRLADYRVTVPTALEQVETLVTGVWELKPMRSATNKL